MEQVGKHTEIPSENPSCIYNATLDTMRAVLKEYGIAVIPSIIALKDCKKIISKLWDDLETVSEDWSTPLSRDDSDTWSGMKNFTPRHNMLIQHRKIGHWPSVWYVRQRPEIAEVFARLWRCKPEDLLTSFDAVSISLPPETTGEGFSKDNSRRDENGRWSVARDEWFHSDTSYCYQRRGKELSDKDIRCYQGWFTPIDVNEGDATLCVLVGSHNYHRRFGKKFKITDRGDVSGSKNPSASRGDWYKLSKEQIDVYVNKYKCPVDFITCSAGSLVLWDSRTIHYGAKPREWRKKDNFRYCFYVCQMPRELATPALLKKKRKAFEEKRMTKHHPIKSNLFTDEPSTRFGKIVEEEQIPELADPVLTPLGRKLAGYDTESDSSD